jgi:hypothetical protein
MAARASCSPALRCACGSVRPETCSTKVPVLQSTRSQKNRRTPEPQHRLLTGDRQIRQVTAVGAVHPSGHPPRPDASRCPRPRMRADPHHPVDPADVIDHHRRQLRKQNAATTAVNSHASRTPRSHGPSAAHLQRPVIPPPRNLRERSSPDRVSISAALTHPSASRNLCQNHLPCKFTDQADEQLTPAQRLLRCRRTLPDWNGPGRPAQQ